MNVRNTNKEGLDLPVMVFSKEKDGKKKYSIGISHKLPDNSYDNTYIPVVFNKGVELENKSKILITNAIIDFYKREDKSVIYYLRVFDFVKADKETESDLPF